MSEEYRFNISTNHLKDIEPLPLDTVYRSSTSSSSTCSPVSSTFSLDQCNCVHKTTCVRLRTQKGSLEYEQTEYKRKEAQLTRLLHDKEECIAMTTYSIQSLLQDQQTLQQKIKEEEEKIVQIQCAQENVKKELEELSLRLFEEAHKMMAIEREEQNRLTNENSVLINHLHSLNTALEYAQNELRILRQQIARPTPPSIDTYTRAQLETLTMHGIETGMETLEDDNVLMEFNDFIDCLSMTPLRKLHSLPYMRYAVREDIEPCLRFGPHPRMASKKIMEAILVKTCFIEECAEGYEAEETVVSLWDRFTTAFSGCQACGRQSDCLQYRFRISYFDEWACIDSHCRNRLMAVIEFYSFLQHLRIGVYKHRSLHELYQEYIRLKLQMFLARMGALSTVLEQCGVADIAKAFKGEDMVYIDYSERLSSSTESTMASTRTSASSYA